MPNQYAQVPKSSTVTSITEIQPTSISEKPNLLAGKNAIIIIVMQTLLTNLFQMTNSNLFYMKISHLHF